jgi:hypothetical protein
LPGNRFGFGRAEGLTVQRMRRVVVVDVVLLLEVELDDILAEGGAVIVVELDDMDENTVETVDVPAVLELLDLEVLEEEAPLVKPLLGD